MVCGDNVLAFSGPDVALLEQTVEALTYAAKSAQSPDIAVGEYDIEYFRREQC